MPACSKAQKSFQRVPPNSTLEVATVGVPSSFRSSVEVIGPDPNDDQKFSHTKVFNNAASTSTVPANRGSYAPLKQKRFYLVRFTVKFNTPTISRATIWLRVVGHSSPIQCWVEGDSSTGTQSVAFFVVTA